MLMVLYWCERLRDGIDEGARVVTDLADAEKLVRQLSNGIGWSNTTVRLFRLGEEVPISIERIEEPQPAKLTGIKLVVKE